MLKVFANVIKLENRTFGLIEIEDDNQNASETTSNQNKKRRNSKFPLNPRWFGFLLVSYVLLMFSVYLGAYLGYGIPKGYLKSYLGKHLGAYFGYGIHKAT